MVFMEIFCKLRLEMMAFMGKLIFQRKFQGHGIQILLYKLANLRVFKVSD